ncbi:MAG: hydantoinase/oxoprolinase family protein [Alphaproteobacteria bacterium]|nr:hydantoinase/oxoprolinase family protein [Alphaproteobacteria bacterium]
MRFACDTGGTFTDLLVEDEAGALHMFKAPTTPENPILGVLDSVQVAADALGMTRHDLLSKGQMFIHGTTRAINAIVTGSTARTALLTTKGNPDVLVFREGGRIEPFNFKVPYPEPYIPRHLTFEITERIGAAGDVVTPLDESSVMDAIARLKSVKVEAIAVGLLWSVANPAHELRVGEMIEEFMPGVPLTLSHQINPIIREYRRTSSAAIDASLKPLMGAYMRNLAASLKEAGFPGRVLVVTSQGGVMDADEIALAPIHSINSGPAMAPVAGRYYAGIDANMESAIVADTGGTTYDVSLIRGGKIPWTRETWIGQSFRGHMTGFPSVDVKSVGAGGGSIASVDSGGMLRVGPKSAGAVPGPVCYGRGGTEPTVTDAALVLGYLDPDNFLGGAMALDTAAARKAIEARVARPLGLSLEDAAAAIIDVVTQNMVNAIDDLTVKQGIDPSKAILIGGGGAAGFNTALIGKRLRCPTAIIPETGAALSAAGALMSDLSRHFNITRHISSDTFSFALANEVLAQLEGRCRAFVETAGDDIVGHSIDFSIEGHYPSQVWDIEAPLNGSRLHGAEDLAQLVQNFHAVHEELFAFADRGSPVEIVSWQAHVRCQLRERGTGRVSRGAAPAHMQTSRRCYFAGEGFVDAPVSVFDLLEEGWRTMGPAIVESSLTTVVVNPGVEAVKAPSGSLILNLGGMK